MTERGTAGERLERILFLLPLAGREGGVSLSEAAERLDVRIETIQGDLEEITARAFYHPAGGADDMQILLETNHVKIYSNRKFDRPVKLSWREALAVAIALRAALRDLGGEPRTDEELRDLLRRIETQLAVIPEQVEPDDDERFEVDFGDDAGAPLRALLRDAGRERNRCRIRYLKDGAPEPEERELDPYVVVYGSGRWYVIGYCHLRKEIRAFRLDRVIEAEVLEVAYETPTEFDAAKYVSGGRVFRSDAEERVVVRYSPLVAAWVREQGPVEEHEEGGVSVSFTSADPAWVVRHVLAYGGEAEVLSPASIRDMVSEAAATVLMAG